LSEERTKDLVTLDRVEQKGTNTNYGIYHQKIKKLKNKLRNWKEQTKMRAKKRLKKKRKR
jgi:hypothetical protein